MNVNEVAELLKMKREEVKIAIDEGVALPKSGEIICLKAHQINKQYDIDELDLDEFIDRFHQEEPGRHPPVKVRRELLVEARHSCAICGETTPIEYHHIIEFSKLGHYDSRHMLALCPTHHAMCTLGRIDTQEQYEYKRRLTQLKVIGNGSNFIYSIGPANFSWDDLRQIIIALHDEVVNRDREGNSKYDFSEIDIQKKNELNRLSLEYYNTVVVIHEPYFTRIMNFLKNPVNATIVNLYYEVVDEIRAKIALSRDDYERFEFFLNTFADIAVKDIENGRSQSRRTINILMSFMYINCDIGRKT